MYIYTYVHIYTYTQIDIRSIYLHTYICSCPQWPSQAVDMWRWQGPHQRFGGAPREDPSVAAMKTMRNSMSVAEKKWLKSMVYGR